MPEVTKKVRQRDRFLVLMQNYDKALKYQKVSLESAGSAEQKMTIYKESAAAATERLTNEFQKLFMAMDSEGIKGFINLGTNILKVTNATGGLRTILVVLIGTLLALKGPAIGAAFLTMLAPIKSMIMVIPILTKAVWASVTANMSFADSLTAVGFAGTTAQLAMSGLFLALTVASVAWGLVSSANEKANQIAEEGLSTYQSEITTLKDLKTKLDETISGTGTESEKRALLIEMIKGMNSEYEAEATNLKTNTELRNLAIAKMKEEGLAAANAFFVKSNDKYQEAKKFMEEAGSVGPGLTGNILTLDYSNVSKTMKELEAEILRYSSMQNKGIELTAKQTLGYQTVVEWYNKLSEKYDELLPYYEQGNAALAIQNGEMEISSETISKTVSAFDAFATVLSSTSSDLSGFSGELDLLDSALTKLAGSQNLTAKEIFALIGQYPELIDSLKESAGVYYLEADAIQSVKNGLIAKNEIELKVAFSSADAVAKSVGINIDSYSQELDAIKTLINAQIVLKQARMQSMQNLSYAAQMGYLKEAQNLKSLLDSIGSLKKQKTMLGLISSGQDIKAISSKTGQDAAQKAADDAQKAMEEAQKKAEDRLKTTIELKLSLIDAEKQAVEDSYDAQIKALEKINDTRQDEIDLIKAKEALLNAQTQKRMVYREGMGFVAEVDAKDIAEAEQTLAEIALDKQIEKLESEKTSALAGQDSKKTDYENQLLQLMKAETNSGLRSVYGSILGLTELDGNWYNAGGQRAFSGGGVADYTGGARLHGTKQKPELVLNNPQASALFNFIQGLANPSITRTPAIAGASNSTMNIGTINLPFVKNGSDFIRELQLISKNR